MQHIDIPTLGQFKGLAQIKGEICISLYLPTSALGESARQNLVAFKDLAREALSQLKNAGADKRKISAFEAQFAYLAGDHRGEKGDEKIRQRQRATSHPIETFWHHQANGLAILATLNMMQTFRLPDKPKPLAEVADRFHLTPLIRTMTSPHDAFVLALAEESVRLVHAFVNFPPQRVHVPDLPRSAEEATGRPSIHVRAPRHRLQNLEGEKVLLGQYVRRVEQALRGVLAEQSAPLILAAVEPTASMFRSFNSYPRLEEEAIASNPDHMTDAELEDAAIPLLAALYARELKAVILRYNELKPKRATSDLSFAAHAATAGAIDQLLVDLDAVVPGVVSDVDGSVTYSASDNAETYSVVDEVARRALCTGARVLAARRQELPGRAPVAAILRYEFD